MWTGSLKSTKVFIFIACIFFSCQNETEIDEWENFFEIKDEVMHAVVLNSLPQSPKQLKILGIGNSFTEDATQYLPLMLKKAGVKNVIIGRILNGGMSLYDQFKHTRKEPFWYYYSKSDSVTYEWSYYKERTSLLEVLQDEDWDIVVLQQSSRFSGIYETYQPSLTKLMKYVFNYCKNKNVCIAWHMTWAYGSGCNNKGFSEYDNNQLNMYESIVKATRKMVNETGINIIIPSGTAVQNLRNTKLNNAPLDLTRDGMHSDEGAGRYVEAATWFETLITPCMGYSIKGNTLRIQEGKVPVTNDNVSLIQKAAIEAVKNKYRVSQL